MTQKRQSKTKSINKPTPNQIETHVKLRSKYDPQLTSPGETNTLPSMTVQGDAMSMAEMIRALTRGEIPPMAESAFHGHDVNMDEHYGARMPQDITEVEELKRQHLQQQVEREAFAQDPREAEGKMTKAEAEESTERAEQSDTQHEA